MCQLAAVANKFAHFTRICHTEIKEKLNKNKIRSLLKAPKQKGAAYCFYFLIFVEI